MPNLAWAFLFVILKAFKANIFILCKILLGNFALIYTILKLNYFLLNFHKK